MRRIIAVTSAFVALLVGSAGAQADRSSYIVVLKDGASTNSAVEKAESIGGKVFAEYRHALSGYAATLTETQLSKVKALPQVDFVSPNRKVQALAQPPQLLPK